MAELSARNKIAANKFAEKHKKKAYEVEKKRLARVKPHFHSKDFEMDYRRNAFKMKTMSMVEDQWMPANQRKAMHLYRSPMDKRYNSPTKRPGTSPNRRRRPSLSSRNSTPDSNGSLRRSGSRTVALEDYLKDGMSSIMPPTSPLRKSQAQAASLLLME